MGGPLNADPDKQQDDNALYTGYFIGQFGDLPVDQITKPVLKDFMDLLERCPRNVPHAIRRASLAERIAWGEKPANLKQPRLARRTVNASVAFRVMVTTVPTSTSPDPAMMPLPEVAKEEMAGALRANASLATGAIT